MTVTQGLIRGPITAATARMMMSLSAAVTTVGITFTDIPSVVEDTTVAEAEVDTTAAEEEADSIAHSAVEEAADAGAAVVVVAVEEEVGGKAPRNFKQ